MEASRYGCLSNRGLPYDEHYCNGRAQKQPEVPEVPVMPEPEPPIEVDELDLGDSKQDGARVASGLPGSHRGAQPAELRTLSSGIPSTYRGWATNFGH